MPSLEHQWFIYLLVDSRVTSCRAQDEVRYVGVSVNPKLRFKEHLRCARFGSDIWCYRWIRQVLFDGFTPGIRVVDSGFGEDTWEEAERFWIRFYHKEVGANLTNMNEGGGGVSNPSAESRQKISVALKGKKVRPEILAKRNPVVHSEDYKRRVSEFHRGRKRSEETCRRIGQGHLNQKRTDAQKLRMRISALIRHGKLS